MLIGQSPIVSVPVGPNFRFCATFFAPSGSPAVGGKGWRGARQQGQNDLVEGGGYPESVVLGLCHRNFGEHATVEQQIKLTILTEKPETDMQPKKTFSHQLRHYISLAITELF